MMRFLSVAVFVVAALAITSTSAWADSFQGFETDTTDWYDGSSYGSTTRVSSGTDGVTSAAGGYHAVVAGDSSASNQASYTDWGSSSAIWPGGWTTSIDVYLDTSWDTGTGFEYLAATSNDTGSWLRDFVFSVAQDDSTGDLIVATETQLVNSYGTKDNLEDFDPNYVVGSTGWYTLEHVFYDDSGVLTVDMNIYNAGGTKVFGNTLTGNDAIADVGGPAWGWFLFIDVADGIHADNSQLTLGAPVPEPGTLALLGLSLFGAAFARRRKLRAS